MRWWLLAPGLVGMASLAQADGAEPRLIQAPVPAAASKRATQGHAGQAMLSLRFGVGLRALAPYHDEFCGETSATGEAGVCTGRAPLALDAELGYGVTPRIDAVLEVRIGIEQDFGRDAVDQDGARVFHVSPGARFFFSDAGSSKLFTTAQLVIDRSGYEDAAGARLGVDLGVRNLNGLWFDLDRAYGVYLYAGETATFVRWLRLELEAGVGLSGRY
jgi:hypothetical protein